jgi:hypothetical protein
VRLLLENWANPDSAATLRSGIQAASHVPIARERVSQLFRTSVLPAVAHSLDDERMERAGLVASQLIGLAVTRYVWRLEPIRSMPDEDVIRYVAPTIQRYLSRRL